MRRIINPNRMHAAANHKSASVPRCSDLERPVVSNPWTFSLFPKTTQFIAQASEATIQPCSPAYSSPPP
jgi:hypothetical protein